MSNAQHILRAVFIGEQSESTSSTNDDELQKSYRDKMPGDSSFTRSFQVQEVITAEKVYPYSRTNYSFDNSLLSESRLETS